MADPEFTFLGDAVWLDFVNTGNGSDGGPADRLPDPAAFHRWTKARKLRAESGPDLGGVRAFRASLRDLALALDRGHRAPASAIAAINAILRDATGREQLTREGGEWGLQFAPDEPPPAVAAIARSAAATLVDPLVRIRCCPGDDCRLFFADASPTQSRRWCSPERCGRGTWVERRRAALR
jgi:predicted RNA-binding Zn ribbon-like protein